MIAIFPTPTVAVDYTCARCRYVWTVDVRFYPVPEGGADPVGDTDCPECGYVEGDELPLPGYCRTCWRDSGEAVRVATTDGADRCAVCIEEGCE